MKNRTTTAWSHVQKKGRRAIEDPELAWEYVVNNVSEHTEKWVNYGIDYLERDWDHLVILDACRFDLFTEFGPRHPVYDSFTHIDSVYSNASSTPIWLERNFSNRPTSALSNINYISATPWITNVETEKLANVRQVWKYSQDPEASVPTPDALTDAAIESYRETPERRSVIHYVQPHAPFLHCAGKYDSKGDKDGGTQTVWKELRDGNFERDDIWEDYGQNLLRVLDEVEILIENLGGDIAVTSDHGNALGEWGFYGHPPHVPLPTIRRVPWAHAIGKDRRSYEIKGKVAMSNSQVSEGTTQATEEQSRDDQLRALGYKV